jgi:hypothetical protein
MEKNYKILRFIEKNNSSTQREIAKGVGFELGYGELYIKRACQKRHYKDGKL